MDYGKHPNHVQPPNVIAGLLFVELPRFSAPVHLYINHLSKDRTNLKEPKSLEPAFDNFMQKNFGSKKTSKDDKEKFLSNIVFVKDYQLYSKVNGKVNDPIEEKYRQLSWNLDPSFEEVQQIQVILNTPVTHKMTESERNLLWNYRRYLSNQGKALKKFLKIICWRMDVEKTEALRLLKVWKDVPPQDGIEILAICKEAPAEVYSYAVSLISKLSDLEGYLLELIQVLKLDYQLKATHGKLSFPLFELLMKRSKEDFKFCNTFYWYLRSEETGVTESENIYKYFIMMLKETLSRDVLATFDRQQKFITDLSNIYDELKAKNLDVETHSNSLKFELQNRFDFETPLPFPMDTSIRIVGFDLTKCSVMKSNARPFRITFKTDDDRTFMVLYKKGDDLRQDMFFLQMLQFVDKLCLSENFDLHLTPYRVLATSRQDGFVEFVQNSTTLADIEIRAYLKEHNPNPNSIDGIDPPAMERFLRSCAGYCVVTYIFGVGDRHQHNLMLKKSGGFFHIDFGYIFGKDPKPFPPPFKLSPSMVTGMGGMKSEQFIQFATYCCEAYNRIRAGGNVILALAMLMADANIQDLDNGEHTIISVSICTSNTLIIFY